MENKVKVVLCDLDGTLCLFEKQDKSKSNYRSPYDASTCENDLMNEAVAKILGFCLKVILVSGREDKYRNQTERWLEANGIEYDALLMRRSGDYRKDSIVKLEIYDEFIKPFYDVEFVLDDRNQVVEMWRDQGLICLQVADGNF